MHSDRIHRRKLRRMPNMDEEFGSISDNGTDSPDFHSTRETNTISHNSMERPHQVSGCGNGQREILDAESTSNHCTTFGSPITSRTSLSHYYTPYQGSSSQETLINHDGDKTTVSDCQSTGDDVSSPVTLNLSSSPVRKRIRPIESLSLPIDEVSQDPSNFKGVVGDDDKSVMTRYAYDPIQRSVDPKAKVLPRSEWRGLRTDLTDQEMEKFNKNHAQEEDGEGEDMDSGPSRGIFDLDDEAEKTLFETGYATLADQLFLCLDGRMQAEVKEDLGNKLTNADVENISRRFSELSMTFKADHATLDKREKRSKSELKFAEGRVKANIDLLERSKDLKSVGKAAEELAEYTQKLVKKAKEVGRIDLEKRMYKMIEVMTMYVHILRNFENPDQSISPGNSKRITNGNDAERSAGSSTSGTKSKESRVGDLGEGQWMRELSWPWSWEQSVKGVQRCFSIILMLAGLVILIQSVFPSANADHCAPTSIKP